MVRRDYLEAFYILQIFFTFSNSTQLDGKKITNVTKK